MRIVIVLMGLSVLITGVSAIGAVFWRTGSDAELHAVDTEEVTPDIVCEELAWEAPVEYAAADIPESEVSWTQMVEEVVILYEQFFDFGNASLTDPRRGNFELYAEYVADAVTTYQNQETDIGGRLPRHRNTHLVVATVITKEASIDADVVGKRGEVGLMQVMPGGPVMANLDPKFVAKRPKLGVLLGARWLAYSVKVCHPDGIEDAEWSNDDWVGVLSAYATKKPISQRTGKCKRFKKSKERVALVEMYRAWIDGELSKR